MVDEYQIFLNEFTYIKKLLNKLKKSEYSKIDNLNLKQRSYNLHNKQYEIVLISVNLGYIKLRNFCRKIYRIMINSGNIIIFTINNLVTKISIKLEETNFVVINSIDLSFENCLVITKKMHGWEKIEVEYRTTSLNTSNL